MLQSLPMPPPFTWRPIATRSILPIFPPPEPLVKPALPSLPRQPTLDAPYTLTTHIVPAAYLRTSTHVPMPPSPPGNATKAERQEFSKKTTKKLRDMRTTLDPQAVPQVLWNCVNRYVRNDLDSARTIGTSRVTLFFAHANGFPKEIWEPTLRHLLSTSVGAVIDEVWTWEAVNHGDACLINQSALSCLYDWTDGSRDTLNFLIHYLPSDATTSPLPTHLDRVPCEESEHRKRRGFRNRMLVAVGHSLGGCTSALAALTQPQLFSSLVLIDPIIVQPIDGYDTILHEQHRQLIFGALMRRETWDSREEALKSLSGIRFFRAWDPEVLEVYVECGTTPTHDSSDGPSIRLKMPGIHEASVFSETHTEYETFQRLPELDERIELLWIMPGHHEASEFGPPGSRQKRVWLRPNNSSNICMPNIGHLIPHEAPQLLAHELGRFILRRYPESPTAKL